MFDDSATGQIAKHLMFYARRLTANLLSNFQLQTLAQRILLVVQDQEAYRHRRSERFEDVKPSIEVASLVHADRHKVRHRDAKPINGGLISTRPTNAKRKVRMPPTPVFRWVVYHPNKL